MSVRRRLERLTGNPARETERTARSEQIATLRQRIDMILSRRTERASPFIQRAHRRPFPLKEILSGEDCTNAGGTCFIQQQHADAGTRHGHRRIGDLAGLSMQAASLLANDGALSRYRIEEGLFLDTETTGLAGGTGTLAFLVGVGWFERDRFVIRQIFARDFTEERAVLTHLSELAGGRRFLVSFNGKAFDLGLLSARFVMNRLPDPFPEMPHLDLLHSSRRLIGHRLENCRLATLEEQILGVIRRDDVPGSEIPQRYFDWLRAGDARPLKDVFEHNRLDIISLAALMGHLATLVGGLPAGRHADARDLLAVARLYAQRRESSRAEGLLASLLHAQDPLSRMEARKRLSLLYRRAGRWEEAVALWRQMVRDDPGDLFALTELAKWCEHRANDPAGALELAGLALEQADRHLTAAEREALLFRMQRLRRRRSLSPLGKD